jgi:signal transduction histidine kinase
MADDRPIRILILDDEPSLMTALANTLRDHGYETAGFTQPTAGLEELKHKRFDVLITDLMMPGMDGIATLRAAHQIDPDMVGIMMTGAGSVSTAVEAMKNGAFDFILKPFKLNAILPVLSRAMEYRSLRLKNSALEDEVRHHVQQLEVVNKELEAFAHTVSHDLRAPLRHITGYVNFLASSKTATFAESDRECLTRIVHASERMARLINDLLAFSRLGFGELHVSKVNSDESVAEVVRQLQPEAQGRNIIWKIGKLPAVEGDPALLRQVWTNLIGNAIKYSRMRDPAVIEIGCVNEPSQETVFFVKDNGAGFDMKYAGKLFGVFQRLHREEEFEGTGVGLANVRRIVGRHGGRTWADATLEGGATFFFAIPKAKADKNPRNSPSREAESQIA